jgi:hypothetical protein
MRALSLFAAHLRQPGTWRGSEGQACRGRLRKGTRHERRLPMPLRQICSLTRFARLVRLAFLWTTAKDTE